MALMQRTQVIWQGFIGAPGYSTFYTRVSDPSQHDTRLAAATLRDAFSALATRFPQDVTFTFPQETELIEDTTGEMVDLMTFEPPLADVDGMAGGPYSAASGAAIEWRTLGVRRGRRVRGRTFFVPLANSQYEEDGTLSQTLMNGLEAFAEEIADEEGPQFLVWSRPIRNPDTGAIIEEGSSHRISSGSVRDRVAVLRSRRD